MTICHGIPWCRNGADDHCPFSIEGWWLFFYPLSYLTLTEYRGILERLDELEREKVIGAFDKRVIIELSGDVLKEIARKYENIQKGVGGMMRGPMIETEARRILNKGINEGKKETVLRMIQDGGLSIEKVAKYSGLAIKEVEELAKLQTV